MRWNGSRSSFSRQCSGVCWSSSTTAPQLRLRCTGNWARSQQILGLARGLSSDHCHCWLQCVTNPEFLSQMHVLSCYQNLTFIERKFYQGHIWQRNPTFSRWKLTMQFPNRVKKRAWLLTGKSAIRNSHHTLKLQCDLIKSTAMDNSLAMYYTTWFLPRLSPATWEVNAGSVFVPSADVTASTQVNWLQGVRPVITARSGKQNCATWVTLPSLKCFSPHSFKHVLENCNWLSVTQHYIREDTENSQFFIKMVFLTTRGSTGPEYISGIN